MDSSFFENSRSNQSDNITVGRILDINRDFRNFTMISDRNLSSALRINVPINARIFDIFGRPMDFARLVPGLRVQVRHASFRTASVPPQTTAFVVRILR